MVRPPLWDKVAAIRSKPGVVHAPTPNGDFCRYVMVGQPGGVESVFKSLKANEKDLNDMAKVVEIVTKEGVNIAG